MEFYIVNTFSYLLMRTEVQVVGPFKSREIAKEFSSRIRPRAKTMREFILSTRIANKLPAKVDFKYQPDHDELCSVECFIETKARLTEMNKSSYTRKAPKDYVNSVQNMFGACFDTKNASVRLFDLKWLKEYNMYRDTPLQKDQYGFAYDGETLLVITKEYSGKTHTSTYVTERMFKLETVDDFDNFIEQEFDL